MLVARISIRSEHRQCTWPADATTPPVCPGATSARPASPSKGTVEAARGRADPQALHAVALHELLWSRGVGIRLQKAISYLQTAARLAGRPAPVLADLSAAYMTRAGWTGNARDLLEAVEFAEQALELEPQNETALFNLALALDRLGMDGEAAEAWRRYLMVDSTSGWAAEARGRTRALRWAPTPRRPLPAGASEADIAAFVNRDPQAARLLAMDTLLAEWGAALLRGDSALAADRLRRADAIGRAREKRGGDASTADAVRAIRAAANDSSALRTLARAHQAYAAGRSAFDATNFHGADSAFARVLAMRPPSPALELWTRYYREAVRVNLGSHEEPARVLRRLAARTDTVRDPTLASHIQSSLGAALYRSGHYQPALDAFDVAARLAGRSHEGERAGGARYFVMDAEFALGAAPQAYASMLQALLALRPYRDSEYLHTLLSVAAEEAAGDGLLRAALRLQDEGVAVARRTGPLYLAEALLWRARLRVAAGDSRGALADIAAGEGLVGKLEFEDREWLVTDLRAARASALLRGDPRRAAAALDSIITDSAGAGSTLRLLQALVERAEARLALNDRPGALADLDRATALLATQRDAVTSAPLRASLLDAMRAVFDRGVMLQVAEENAAAALTYLERGRASFAPTGPNDAGEQSGSGRWRVPRGSVAVEYALIGDTLLIWTVSDTAVALTRRRVDRAALVESIQRVRSALETRAAERAGSAEELRAGQAAVRAQLAALYGLLVEPVRERLGPKETGLVLIADGALAEVPFAALHDTASHRYLIQDHPLRFAGSLRDAAPAARPLGEPRGLALFVADPAFDVRAHPGLPPLPRIAEGARRIAERYPRRRVVSGPQAGRDSVLAALSAASLFYFAGHAVYDEQRPERSFLLLAAGAGRSDPGRMTAAELGARDLSHVRLVVLAACETLRARDGSSAGFAGFAGALLAAGAGGVVGSLWRVDEERTNALMEEFHAAYRRSWDGDGALRQAQLALLGSDDPALSSPSAWAGFRFAGN
ncbi:MAG TPA: CHAT domain-containing protein [Longimicrobium sp.]